MAGCAVLLGMTVQPRGMAAHDAAAADDEEAGLVLIDVLDERPGTKGGALCATNPDRPMPGGGRGGEGW